jgi:hypothetical protein
MRTAGVLVFLVIACGCGPHGPAKVVPVGSPAPEPRTDPAPVEPAERVENPLYACWAGFPPGTAVVYRSVTTGAHPSVATRTRTTYTLRERTDDHVTIDLKATKQLYDGVEIDNPPSSSRMPAGFACRRAPASLSTAHRPVPPNRARRRSA